jgi:dephospho-CoA kinase
MRVIGVAGDIGSGKDEVLKYLGAKYGVPYIATGDIVRQMAEREDIEPTRENLQSISQRCFQQWGKGCFVRMAAEEMASRGWQVAGISGIRSPDDVEIMRQAFGKDFVLVRVDVTDPVTRFERMRLRREERDPVTFEQFLAQDKKERQVFSLDKTGSMADYAVNNDHSLQDLHRQVDELVSAKLLLRGSGLA